MKEDQNNQTATKLEMRKRFKYKNRQIVLIKIIKKKGYKQIFATKFN